MVCFYPHWFQDNRTALDIAVQLNHVLVAELLLDRGASLTGCNEVSFSQTVLYHSKLCPFSLIFLLFLVGRVVVDASGRSRACRNGITVAGRRRRCGLYQPGKCLLCGCIFLMYACKKLIFVINICTG